MVKQDLVAFYAVDKFPFLKSGTIVAILNDGLAELEAVEDKSNVCVVPLFIVTQDTADQLRKDLEVLENKLVMELAELGRKFNEDWVHTIREHVSSFEPRDYLDSQGEKHELN